MRAGEGEGSLRGERAERAFWHSQRQRKARGCGRWRTRRVGGRGRRGRGGGAGPGALSAVHVQRADSNHGGRVFFKKLEFR